MDAKSLALLQKTLKAHHYSLTSPRKTVCELLWQQEPLSMQELAARSRGKLDRASLYRTVALFERLGIVRRIYIGWKYKVELSDVFVHHHHHLSCLECGKIIAITEEAEVETFINAISRRHKFTASTHQLEIAGLCPDCTAA